MNKRNDIIFIILAVLLVCGVGYWIWQRNVAEVPAPGSGGEAISESDQRYESREHGLSFSYPASYFLAEKDISASHHAIMLVEDTEENRAVLEESASGAARPSSATTGSGAAREGPIAITIDIRDNPSGQSAGEWARASSASNLLLGDGLAASSTVDGLEGIAYRWSGLYEGESVVVASRDRIYVFTATHIEPTDPTVRDFADVLASARIRE